MAVAVAPEPSMPTTAVPMSTRKPAAVAPEPFDGPEWMFEPKYDGFRALLLRLRRWL